MGGITPVLASAVKPRHAAAMSVPAYALACIALVFASTACNGDLIDPSDAAVIEVTPDTRNDTNDAISDSDVPVISDASALTVSSITTSATGIAARVCWSGSSEFDPTSVSASFGDTAVSPRFINDDSLVGCFDLDATLPPGKHSLHVAAADTSGVAATPLWLPLWVEATPFDWRKSLLYMVMVDRFRDSDGKASPEPDVQTTANYQGGDLGGVQDAIEDGYFDALGVDALWITPVLDNPAGGFIGLDNVHIYAGYHGYWPISATAIDDHLAPAGTTGDDAFASMIGVAHGRGTRIVLDVVLNHVHEQHPYCTERPAMCKHTCVCGTANCDWEARALDCQFAAYLPDLDYSDPETLARVVTDLMAFVAKYDIDGLRLDAVKHMDPIVLRTIRARTDAIAEAGGAPFWLVGETFAGSSERGLVASFLDDGLDGQFDFPLYWQIRDTFVADASFRALETALVDSGNAYGDALALMSPFLGNHDVERIATALAKNDLGPWGGTVDVVAENTSATPSRWDVINPLTMAMAFVLTLPGVPLVYMGDELGLGGSNDPDNRRLLPVTPATDQAEILRRVRELGRARRDNPVLAVGARRELWQDDDIYVQARWAGDAGDKVDTVIIAMNKGETRTVTVTLPPGLGADGRAFRSLLSDRMLTANGNQLELSLGSWEYVLLRAE